MAQQKLSQWMLSLAAAAMVLGTSQAEAGWRHGSRGSHGSWGSHGSSGSHGSWGSHGSRGSHGSHGSWGSHGSRGSHGSHGSWGYRSYHGSHGSWGSHGSHGSWGSHGGYVRVYKSHSSCGSNGNYTSGSPHQGWKKVTPEKAGSAPLPPALKKAPADDAAKAAPKADKKALVDDAPIIPDDLDPEPLVKDPPAAFPPANADGLAAPVAPAKGAFPDPFGRPAAPALNDGDLDFKAPPAAPAGKAPPKRPLFRDPFNQGTSLPAESVLMMVSVPADATIFVNDKLTTSTGAVRQFISNGLKPGQPYRYQLRAEVRRDGKTITRNKVIYLRPGERTDVEFSFDQQPQVASEPLRTKLSLNVPKDARVFLAGQEMKATGTVREFETTKLAGDKSWTDYTVRVVVEREGREVAQERAISLAAGKTLELTFDFDTPQVASSDAAATR
jgi:uncharacterized protein (TIGR03000 family)